MSTGRPPGSVAVNDCSNHAVSAALRFDMTAAAPVATAVIMATSAARSPGLNGAADVNAPAAGRRGPASPHLRAPGGAGTKAPHRPLKNLR